MHRSSRSRSALAQLALASIALLPAAVVAQSSAFDGAVAPRTTDDEGSASEKIRARAEHDRGYRIVVSLEDRRLWVISQTDTLMEAPVAVGSGVELRGLGRSWAFRTPRGVRTVLRKKVDPVWQPPDWMYVETAQEYGLKVEKLSARKPRVLSDGSKLVVRDDVVQVVTPDSTYTPSLEDHLVFDDIVFIPPEGTKNRRVEGELGKYALDTGDGYMLHGTPFQDTVGQKVSHGCIRLKDDDIAWLYENVPVGTRVYLY